MASETRSDDLGPVFKYSIMDPPIFCMKLMLNITIFLPS